MRTKRRRTHPRDPRRRQNSSITRRKEHRAEDPGVYEEISGSYVSGILYHGISGGGAGSHAGLQDGDQ